MSLLPKTGDELLGLLRKSRLMPAAKLDAFLATVPDPARAGATSLARLMLGRGLLTVFQAKQLLQGRHRGFYVGKYLVLEGLGAGGMSNVFLARHLAMGHRVALKFLPENLARDPLERRRFVAEARAVAALNHPNIARAYDVDRHGGQFYMVMEYVEGASLHALVKRHGPFTPAKAASCAAQVALGLQHLHEAGLVHRDLKPGNLLLDLTGTIKVLDLGLALDRNRPLHESAGGDDPTAVVGTADFLAPEQAVTSLEVDIRADIYSLGATLYFMLAGKGPFEDEPVARKLLLHQKVEPPPPPGPPELVALVQRLMAKKPADRPQTPAEVVDALEPFVAESIEPPDVADLPMLSRAAGAPSSHRLMSTKLSTQTVIRRNGEHSSRSLVEPPDPPAPAVVPVPPEPRPA